MICKVQRVTRRDISAAHCLRKSVYFGMSGTRHDERHFVPPKTFDRFHLGAYFPRSVAALTCPRRGRRDRGSAAAVPKVCAVAARSRCCRQGVRGSARPSRGPRPARLAACSLPCSPPACSCPSFPSPLFFDPSPRRRVASSPTLHCSTRMRTAAAASVASVVSVAPPRHGHRSGRR